MFREDEIENRELEAGAGGREGERERKRKRERKKEGWMERVLSEYHGICISQT